MIDGKKEHCPVCGMKVGAGPFTLEYHKMIIHFCSEQCRETFKTHPGLYNSKQDKDRVEVIKRRRMRLSGPLDPEAVQAITEYLQALMGVKEIHLEGRSLLIRYDLLQLTLMQIERSLNEVDIELDNSWWQRLRRSWTHNTEKNELDNLASTPGTCCNRPPPHV